MFTCSKSTRETVEKGVKYVKCKQQRHQNKATEVVLVEFIVNFVYISLFSKDTFVDTEQVNICGDIYHFSFQHKKTKMIIKSQKNLQ